MADKIFIVLMNFLEDTRKPNWSKYGLIIMIFLGLYIVNQRTGFSFYYANNRKLEIIKQIAEIKKDSTFISKDELEYVNAIKLSTIHKVDKLALFTSNIKGLLSGMLAFPGVMIKAALFDEGKLSFLPPAIDLRTHFICANLCLFIILIHNAISAFKLRGSIIIRTFVFLITEYITLIGMVILSYGLGAVSLVFPDHPWITYSVDILMSLVFIYVFLLSITESRQYDGSLSDQTAIILAVVRDGQDKKEVSKRFNIRLTDILELERIFWEKADVVFESDEHKKKWKDEVQSLHMQIGILKAEKEALRKSYTSS